MRTYNFTVDDVEHFTPYFAVLAYDPRADRSLHFQCTSFYWSDEMPEFVDDGYDASLRHFMLYLLSYRKVRMYGEDVPAFVPHWNRLKERCPEWPGFRAERMDASLIPDLETETNEACAQLQRMLVSRKDRNDSQTTDKSSDRSHQINLQYGEAWLLEILAMNRLPVHCMTRAERPMQDWLNRGYHGLSKHELVSVLTNMFQRGEIDAHFDDEDQRPVSLTEFLLELDNTNPKRRMSCGVTPLGGKRWEELATPDWSRYFEHGDCGDYYEITASNLERLQELVDNASILWPEMEIVSELERLHFSPWQPLSWKTLPHGYSVRLQYEQGSLVPAPFDLSEFNRRILEREQLWPRYIELQSWAKSICGSHLV